MGSDQYRRRREALGLSRARLGRLAGIASSTVALIEGGWRPVRGESKAIEKLENTLKREETAGGVV